MIRQVRGGKRVSWCKESRGVPIGVGQASQQARWQSQSGSLDLEAKQEWARQAGRLGGAEVGVSRGGG